MPHLLAWIAFGCAAQAAAWFVIGYPVVAVGWAVFAGIFALGWARWRAR